MKTKKELKQYYETNILPELLIIEKQRKKIKNKLILSIFIAVLIFLISFVIIATFSLGMIFLIIPLCICFIIFFGFYSSFYSGFADEFKDKVIREIVEFIDPGLTYEKNSFVPKTDFVNSKIFNQSAEYYQGDDLVSGIIGKTEIRFSEINAKHVEKTGPSRETGSSRKKANKTYPIFKGLFFIADFNKDFKGSTLVLPDTAEKLFGRLGQKLQSMNVGRDQLIKLEDLEFEKLFVVYGEDQIESRYILSTSLMKRLVDFKKKTKKKLFISFVASKAYIAISYNRELFEPGLFKTLIDFIQIQEYFEDLQIAVGIVEDLNLNTRIWSKQ